MIEVGKKYKLKVNPDFSGGSRVGWEVECIELIDEKGGKYLAFRDEKGVSWPADESQI